MTDREGEVLVFTEFVADWFHLKDPERSERMLDWRLEVLEGQPLSVDWAAEDRARFERYMEQQHRGLWRKYHQHIA